jgi:TIR domain-containing protein
MMIFVNYRRDDSRGMAGRLHDRLAQAFGRKNIFMDVDHIPPGVDFVSHLNNQVAACEVFLAVIGPNWLDAKNEDGDRRLHAPEDFVALEITAALDREIRVIPVLVDGTRMPKARDLPEVLKPLARRHAIELRHDQFGRDAEALIERIREALPAKRTTTLRSKAAAGIAAALLLLGSSWLLTGMPRSLPSAVRFKTQAQSERPVAAEVVKPPDQTEKVRPAIQAVVNPPAQAERATRAQDAQPPEQFEEPTMNDHRSGLFEAQKLGFDLTYLSDELRSKYKIKDDIKGVLIMAVDSPSQASERGLSAGDVIATVAMRPVSDVGQIGQVFERLKKNGKKNVLLYVFNKDGVSYYTTLSMQ